MVVAVAALLVGLVFVSVGYGNLVIARRDYRSYSKRRQPIPTSGRSPAKAAVARLAGGEEVRSPVPASAAFRDARGEKLVFRVIAAPHTAVPEIVMSQLSSATLETAAESSARVALALTRWEREGVALELRLRRSSAGIVLGAVLIGASIVLAVH